MPRMMHTSRCRYENLCMCLPPAWSNLACVGPAWLLWLLPCPLSRQPGWSSWALNMYGTGANGSHTQVSDAASPSVACAALQLWASPQPWTRGCMAQGILWWPPSTSSASISSPPEPVPMAPTPGTGTSLRYAPGHLLLLQGRLLLKLPHSGSLPDRCGACGAPRASGGCSPRPWIVP